MEGTLIVAQPIRMASDSPIFILEFDDGHPYSGGIFREKGLAFGEHNDLCEVLYDVLLGKLSKRGVPTLFHNANVKPIVTSRYRRSVAQKISEWKILLRCSNERQDDCSTSYEMVWYQL
jgi:hypothetical protein